MSSSSLPRIRAAAAGEGMERHFLYAVCLVAVVAMVLYSMNRSSGRERRLFRQGLARSVFFALL